MKMQPDNITIKVIKSAGVLLATKQFYSEKIKSMLL
jgi:hypothetical protein